MRMKLKNKGISLGYIDYNKKNISKLSMKYKIIIGSLLLGSGIIVSAISYSNKANKDIKNNDESLVYLNDYEDSDLYIINDGDNILFVDSEYVNNNNYVIVDNLETRFQFIDDVNRVILSDADKYKDMDLSYYKKLYTLYNMADEEYVDSNMKESVFHEDYLYELSGRLIEEIQRLGIRYYMPEAITNDEYKKKFSNEDESYVINNYYVEKNSTLSEIINQTADDKQEYEEYYNYAVKENKIANPDLIYADSYIKLKVDKGDLENMGYELYTTPREEFNEEYFWIKDNINSIHALSGDIKSTKDINELSKDVKKFIRLADDYILNNPEEAISEELLNMSRNIVDRISLYGLYFKPEAKYVRKVK